MVILYPFPLLLPTIFDNVQVQTKSKGLCVSRLTVLFAVFGGIIFLCTILPFLKLRRILSRTDRPENLTRNKERMKNNRKGIRWFSQIGA